TCTSGAGRPVGTAGAAGCANGRLRRGAAGGPGRDPAGEDPTMEADRKRAVAEERVVEVAQRERVAEARLLVGPEREEEDLAEQVRELVRRGVRVAPDLGPGVRFLEARLLDEEPDRLVDADLAAVQSDVA